MNLPGFDPQKVPWSFPWVPLPEENEAVAFGHDMGQKLNREVAPTVLAELHQEICTQHPWWMRPGENTVRGGNGDGVCCL